MDAKGQLHSGLTPATSIGLVIAGMCLTASCSVPGKARETNDAERPRRAATIRLVPQSMARRLTLQGELQPFQEVDVRSKVAGYVKQIQVDAGTRVRKGDLLVVLAVPEIEHEHQQALAVVTRRTAEFSHAQEDLRRAESAHQSVHLSAQRLKQVSQSNPNLVPDQEVDDALSKDASAEAEIAGARAALAASQAALEDSKANVGRVRSLLEYSRITSPFPAVVTRRYVHTGAMVPAGTNQGEPLLRISQNDPLRLVIPIPELAVPFVKPGTRVRIHVPVLDRTFWGFLSRCAGQVDSATRTMRVEIDIANPKLELAPGEYAEVEVLLQHKENVLAVPIEAVLSPGRKPSVLVVGDNGVIQQRPVTLGLESPTRVEILSGLSPNELVVASTPRQFIPGQRVDPGIPATPTPTENE